MIEFRELQAADSSHLRNYYVNCNYRLCEYSFGTKWMWRGYLHPVWTETAGCLIVRNTIEGQVVFDYPVAGENGDVEEALSAIEQYCTDRGIHPVLSVVPEKKTAELLSRYPRVNVTNERVWKDYLYHAEDLAQFAGRRYSGQRNHINKFRKTHPDARFIPLSQADGVLLEQFWADYAAEFHKDNKLAQWELAASREMFDLLDTGVFYAGGMLSGGKLIAVSLGEKCGSTLITHIEKALYSHEGVYPTMVQSFAAYYGTDCCYVNREDDARDKGLRTSKLQYLPCELGSKYSFAVGNELDTLAAVPTLHTERLTLDAFTAADQRAYNALCLDDARNRWWGYDYRDDLHGELTEDYFLNVVREDFAARRAVNFAIRLDGACIGEAVLYNCDWRGGMELGCRIAPEFAGHGYGTETFSAVAEWALYRLGLAKVTAKCYHENAASYRMLSSCMRKTGQDETFVYFEKIV
mgnify:CR=1 FL=1